MTTDHQTRREQELSDAEIDSYIKLAGMPEWVAMAGGGSYSPRPGVHRVVRWMIAADRSSRLPVEGEGTIKDYSCARCGCMDLVRNDPQETEAEQPSAPSAMSRYIDLSASDDSESPLERLRFFCSLAMNAQDWIDVECFFDDILAAAPPSSGTEAGKGETT